MKKLYFFLLAFCSFTSLNAQWYQQYSGVTTNLHAVFCISDSIVLAAGDNGLILRTDNMGYNWQAQTTGVIQDLNALDFPDSLVGYAVGDTGTIIKTIDGGITWSMLSAPDTINFNSVVFVDADTGYVVGNMGRFFKTTNGGSTWTSLSLGGCCGMMNTLAYAGEKIYLLASDMPGQMLFSSSDGGITWQNWTDPEASSDGWWNGTAMAVYDDGIQSQQTIAGSDGAIKHVLNMTGYLNMFGMAVSSNPLHGICFDYRGTTTATAVGDNGVIGLYPNAGPGTATQNSGVSTNLNAVKFYDATTGYIVGDGGVILSNFDVHAGVSEIQPYPYRMMSYPNPFSISATVVCNTDMENASLTLLDIYGREVQQVSNVNGHTLNLDRNGLPAGTYFLRIEQKGKVLSAGKMMVVD